MKSLLLLALTLWTGGAFGLFSFPTSSRKDASLDNLRKHLDILSKGVDNALHLAHFMVDQHRQFSKSLDAVWKNQDKLEAESSTAETVVSHVFQNTEDILDRQKQLQKGQQNIKQLITKEHHLTRERVEALEKNVGNHIERVAKNQKTILAKIEQGRSKAENFVEQFLHVKVRTENQVKGLLKSVVSNQAANAKGQSKILELIFHFRNDVSNRLNKLSQNQGAILKSIDSSQKNVENSIDKVIQTQGVIADAVVTSQNAKLSELETLKKEQRKTQDRVKDGQAAILSDISDIRKNEDGTQHILHKCKESNCDPSKTIDIIKHILKKVEEFEMDHAKDIHGILDAEAKTSNEVSHLQTNVLKVLSNNVDGTLHEVKAVGKSLGGFLSETESIVKAFAKDVETLENNQEAIEHQLKKLLSKIKDLDFSKGKKKPDFDFH